MLFLPIAKLVVDHSPTPSIVNIIASLYGDGKNVRDWLFVEDHVDALITSVTKGKVGRTYCIGANNERSNLEIAESICKLFDENFPKKRSHSDLIKFVKDRPGHDKRYAINSELITKELGWEAKHDFDQALSKTIDWYLANKEWYKNIQQKSGYQGQRIGLN